MFWRPVHKIMHDNSIRKGSQPQWIPTNPSRRWHDPCHVTIVKPHWIVWDRNAWRTLRLSWCFFYSITADSLITFSLFLFSWKTLFNLTILSNSLKDYYHSFSVHTIVSISSPYNTRALKSIRTRIPWKASIHSCTFGLNKFIFPNDLNYLSSFIYPHSFRHLF